MNVHEADKDAAGRMNQEVDCRDRTIR